ncbi:hypothetical protein [Rhodopila sp.]|uniref:hypothetical protein n=1 Tax=Rhodopila sp. TaxID=2480087 RepID=UPI003D0AF1E7
METKTVQQAAEDLHIACMDAGKVYADVRKNLEAWEDRFSERMNIVTSHVFPPIPDCSHDWCAYFEGTEESGNYGWGKTKRDAILDLINHFART